MDSHRVIAVASAFAVLAVVPASPVQAATKTASGSSYAKKIKTLLRARLSTIELSSVTCPSKVTIKVGYTFTCKTKWGTGDRPNLRVRIRNRSGNFTVTPRTLPMRDLEDRLALVLSRDNLTGNITCPGSRTTKKGDSFTCAVAFTNGAVGEFECTQLGDGRVTESYRTISGDPEPNAGQPGGAGQFDPPPVA